MSDRSPLQGLYGITDARLLTTDKTLVSAVEAALRGGMRMLQYRDKHQSLEVQQQLAQRLRRQCHQHGALFIVNDNVELAHRVNADGVHLGGEDADIATARAMLGTNAIIGRSCYNRLELALSAQVQGADYVAFGRFFASRTKPHAVPAEPRLLAEARQQLTIPLCAIGGITADNAQLLIAQGAHMVAVIDDLFSASDIEARAKQYQQLFN